jgi:hypothetical protein
MITSLRNRHRIVVTALAVIAPAVFVSGLMARKPFPASERSPIILQIIRPIIRPGVDSKTTSAHLAEPDTLVYWSEARPSAESIPDNAKLLGKLQDVQVEMLSSADRPGYLIFYSLAHRKIVAIDQLTQGGVK